MELFVGTDIIEIDRIKMAIEKSEKKHFVEKIFTANEIKYCEEKNAAKFESYAARFAGKEAVSKAFGTGIGAKAAFNEIEILNDNIGRPYVILHGSAKEYYEKIGASGISISLSHCKSYAIAYVTIYVNKKGSFT
ncbi:holo-ACP synthase [Ruminiclostridium herbifermentans]|uniref:Holo-[acyl-carrier-protein] synthase n=1 Tax=Ruminiclostridium herbifermentans TaxID=2488810 RepID=A0A4U7JGB3_9FIRM|nr:holo-ACP synthase [Ruminiclostridium herbifermentans]QNU67010.1 holo-ACP synthase [Ruminiclostridium herbifermentans]